MARKQPRLQADADTQTDTHIMAPYIDKEYEWNEWEMRRKGTFYYDWLLKTFASIILTLKFQICVAIKLANLRRYVTHSTQTVFSNYKRENETQVYLPKVRKCSKIYRKPKSKTTNDSSNLILIIIYTVVTGY